MEKSFQEAEKTGITGASAGNALETVRKQLSKVPMKVYQKHRMSYWEIKKAVEDLLMEGQSLDKPSKQDDGERYRRLVAMAVRECEWRIKWQLRWKRYQR